MILKTRGSVISLQKLLPWEITSRSYVIPFLFAIVNSEYEILTNLIVHIYSYKNNDMMNHM